MMAFFSNFARVAKKAQILPEIAIREDRVPHSRQSMDAKNANIEGSAWLPEIEIVALKALHVQVQVHIFGTERSTELLQYFRKYNILVGLSFYLYCSCTYVQYVYV